MKVGRALTQTAIVGVVLAAVSGCVAQGPPSLPIVSSIDGERIIKAALDQRWQIASASNPGVSRPQIARIKVVTPREQDAVLVACLNAAGFDARVSEFGGVESTGSGGQAGLYDMAFYTCTAKYPVDPRYLTPLSAAEAHFLYDYYKNQLVTCLKSQGYSPEPVPSFQNFAAGLGTVAAYSPYASLPIPTGNQQTFAELNTACPQKPVGFREG